MLADPGLVQAVDVAPRVEEAQPIAALQPDVPNLEGAGVGELTDALVGADSGMGTAGEADVEIRRRLSRRLAGAADRADDRPAHLGRYGLRRGVGGARRHPFLRHELSARGAANQHGSDVTTEIRSPSCRGNA